MTRALNTHDAIRHLVLHDPMIPSEDIAKRLEALTLDVPTKAYINCIKGHIKDMMRFLRREGLLEDEPYELPVSMGGTRECPQESDSVSYAGETKLAGRAREPVSMTKLADRFLRSYLGKHGESWERDVMEAAQAKDFTQDQIRRARGRLNITRANGCVRKVGLEGWKWNLPEDGK